MNATGEKELPYAFGGDGATLLIPPRLLEATLSALAAVRKKIKASLHLDLRTGCVSLQALYAERKWLKVSRFNLSPHMSQAVFQGNALSLAECWLKRDDKRIIRPAEDETASPDLSGLKCRWKPISSRNGKVISLLVRDGEELRRPLGHL